MEGQPKSSTEKVHQNESLESVNESIDHALALLTELQQFNNVEVIGGEAMALNSRAEELAAELKEVLKNIPAKECIENSLPYHPTDEKVSIAPTPLPAKPDYPLSYPVAAKAA